MTFTPTYSGPLHVEQRQDGRYAIIDSNGNLFALTLSSVDARLIAASPDLLAALQALVAQLDDLPDYRGHMVQLTNNARLALNKAQSL